MKLEAEEEMNVLCTKPNNVFKFVKFIRKEGRDIERKGSMKNKDGRLVVSDDHDLFLMIFSMCSFHKDRRKLWKQHMQKIMNVENEWDQMIEADMVEGPVEGVTDEKLMEAIT